MFDSGFGIRDSGFGIRDAGYYIRGSGFGIRGTGFGTRGTGFGIRDCRVPESGIRDSGFEIRDPGFGYPAPEAFFEGGIRGVPRIIVAEKAGIVLRGSGRACALYLTLPLSNSLTLSLSHSLSLREA